MTRTPKEKISAVFYQLSEGCLSINCTCPFCKSNSEFNMTFQTNNEIAAKAIQIAKEKDFDQKLCPGLSPLSYNRLAFKVIDDFRKILTTDSAKEAKELLQNILDCSDAFPFILQTKNKPITESDFLIDNDDFATFIKQIARFEPELISLKGKFYECIKLYLKDQKVTTYYQIRLMLVIVCFDLFLIDYAVTPSFILFCETFISLDLKAQNILQKQFELIHSITLNALKIFQTNITILSSKKSTIDKIPQLSKFVGFLHTASINSEHPIPTTVFYNEPITKFLKRIDDVTFMHNIYDVVTLQTKYEDLKSRFLRMQVSANNFEDGVPHLVIEVDRERILDEAIEIISNITQKELLKKLSIKFTGESAVDAGGVSREFFYLLISGAFQPDYGMFRLIGDGTYWFTPKSIVAPIHYQVLGTVVSLAIYNGVLLPIRFPQVLFKKLLGFKTRLEDLAEVEPEVVESLLKLRRRVALGEDITDVCLNFAVTVDNFGVADEVELIKGGADLDVSSENFEEYVRALVGFYLDQSVDAQFEAFQRGFWRNEGMRKLKKLFPDELSSLVSGAEATDWDSLQATCRYDNGYAKGSPQVVWFWQFFAGLSEPLKRQFLRFCTGSDRAPVGGLRSTNLIIQRSLKIDKLPESHTCVNMLTLPEYPDKETLEKKMLTAIQFSEGFGLT